MVTPRRTIGAMPNRAVLVRRLLRASVIGLALALATAVVAVLETFVHLPDASMTYLVPVVIAAVASGTLAALGTAVAAVLLYDYLFTQPVHSLVITDPEEWLTILLLLFVGATVGRLAAHERDRAEAAAAREQEARAAFRIGWTIAIAPDTRAALPDLLELVRTETRFHRLWVALGPDEAAERVVVDTAGASDPAPARPPTVRAVLQRKPGDEPASWRLVHGAGRTGGRSGRDFLEHGVAIESGSRRFGSLRALRAVSAGSPVPSETRLISSAADLVAIGLERDSLAADALDAEVVRRSDALKSALLASVSHDLRTPLAAIRAAAGNLADPDIAWSTVDARVTAAAIDRDASRLARLVGDLLDVSRIEGGALRPEPVPIILADAAIDALDRLRPILGARPIEVDLAAADVAIVADPMYLDQVLTNLIENVARHTPDSSPVRVVASDRAGLVLTIEDGGPGLSDADVAALLERRFGDGWTRASGGRPTGLGLIIARGLIEATGGSLAARRSGLGGLAIDIRLPPVLPVSLDAEGGRPETGVDPGVTTVAPSR